MAEPGNAPIALGELALLVDEILHLAGDTSTDGAWYTKRAELSAIYSLTELFMTQDTSPAFKETENFLDRRLEEAHALRKAAVGIADWVGFSTNAAINVLRSKGLNI